MNIAIVGAGIGGLVSALALGRLGHDVRVFEQAERLEDIGAGIQLSPNAMQVLRALDLDVAVLARACVPVALEMRRGHSGRSVFSIPMGDECVKRYGAPYVHIHRGDLIAVLSDAVRRAANVRLKLSARVVELVVDRSSSRIGLANGEVFDVDLLVGADGLKSVVAAKVFGDRPATYTGCVAWRMLVPVDGLETWFGEPRATVWTGAGKHAVTYPVRGGALVNFVGVTETSDFKAEGWREPGDMSELISNFDGWAEPVQRVLAAGSTCFRWGLFARKPRDVWYRERVVLLGDACHPMLPFQAQGAAMAIEDAWALAKSMEGNRGDEVEVGLKRYQARRRGRVRKVVASAAANKDIFHRQNPLSQLATYAPMTLADRMVPAFVRSRQDWLYGHDETKG